MCYLTLWRQTVHQGCVYQVITLHTLNLQNVTGRRGLSGARRRREVSAARQARPGLVLAPLAFSAVTERPSARGTNSRSLLGGAGWELGSGAASAHQSSGATHR